MSAHRTHLPIHGRARGWALLALTGTILALLGAAGCGGAGGAGGAGGVLSRLEPLQDNCDGPLNGYAGVDFSATGRGDQALTEERLDALHGMADQIAACGGYMKVVAFSASSADTFTLGEADLSNDSGTDTAQLLARDKAEDSLFGDVEDKLVVAERNLNPNGSDILAQLELAHQYQDQRGDGTLYVALETDGIATTKPVKMNTPSFTEEVAQSEAKTVTVPDLTGATVHVVGIGKTTGQRQLHTSRIEAIRDFYTITCERTHAHCMVTTDSTREG